MYYIWNKFLIFLLIFFIDFAVLFNYNLETLPLVNIDNLLINYFNSFIITIIIYKDNYFKLINKIIYYIFY